MSHLVIVESPSKSKTISKYLSDDFVVKSSKGHIRDLAISGKGGLGVDIENEFGRPMPLRFTFRPHSTISAEVWPLRMSFNTSSQPDSSPM